MSENEVGINDEAGISRSTASVTRETPPPVSDWWLHWFISVSLPLLLISVLFLGYQYRAARIELSNLIMEKLVVSPKDVLYRLDEITKNHHDYVAQARKMSEEDILLITLLISGPEFSKPEDGLKMLEYIKQYRAELAKEQK